MIGKTFSESCKLMNISRVQLSDDTGVPIKTLGTWYKTKPKLMSKLFDSYSTVSNSELNNALSVIERLKITIDTLTRIKDDRFKTYEPIEPIEPIELIEPIDPIFSEYFKQIIFFVKNSIVKRCNLSCLGFKPISVSPNGSFTPESRNDLRTYINWLINLSSVDIPDYQDGDPTIEEIIDYVESSNSFL